MDDDETTIRQIIERWAAAAHEGDLEGLIEFDRAGGDRVVTR